jgi:hypothetical protein
LDLEQAEPVLVIEGLLTDREEYQHIKLSKTTGFNASGAPASVGGAEVWVESDGGELISYEETAPGYYQPVNAFKGIVGERYTLTVKVEGQTYTATEQMYYVPPFDSLSTRIDEQEMEDPEEEGLYHELLFYIKEPQQTEDYYYVKFYRNDTIQNWDGEGVFYTDDAFLSDDIAGLPSPFYYAQGDNARIEMYSISREGFIHYSDLDNNINNDGGMFSGQPANVRTNVRGGAVGYFQVSSMAVSEIEVGD